MQSAWVPAPSLLKAPGSSNKPLQNLELQTAWAELSWVGLRPLSPPVAALVQGLSRSWTVEDGSLPVAGSGLAWASHLVMFVGGQSCEAC